MIGEKSKSILGVVAGICVCLIVLGSLALTSIYNRFATKNNVVGSPEIIELDGDVDNFELSDDESVFLSYSTTTLNFDEYKRFKYAHKVVFDKMNLARDKGYTIYLNAQPLSTTRVSGQLISTPGIKFNPVGAGKSYIGAMEITASFYNNRTELVLATNDRTLVGYINQVAKVGLNIRIVEHQSLNSTPEVSVGDDLQLDDDFDKNFYLFDSRSIQENGINNWMLLDHTAYDPSTLFTCNIDVPYKDMVGKDRYKLEIVYKVNGIKHSFDVSILYQENIYADWILFECLEGDNCAFMQKVRVAIVYSGTTGILWMDVPNDYLESEEMQTVVFQIVSIEIIN